MIILEHFSKLMDLPPDKTLTEAKNKFVNCYLIINNLLHKIKHIDTDNLIISEREDPLNGRDINSIEVWLPDSGVYITSPFQVYAPCILKKRPLRQYKQSFSWDFYTASREITINSLFTSHKIDNVYIYKSYLYFIDIRIGECIKGKWKCTNKIFQSEYNKFIEDNMDKLNG